MMSRVLVLLFVLAAVVGCKGDPHYDVNQTAARMRAKDLRENPLGK